MDPSVKKALIIVVLVFFTLFLIRHITNAPTGSTTTTKTVIVDPVHRYYYGFGTPAGHHNAYKAQYYN
jgi:hypothetical protein